MNTASIIQEIDAEISRLHQVKAILTGTAAERKPGRPTLSAEDKAKIAEAQKARWAKLKRAGKKASKMMPQLRRLLLKRWPRSL
jgi:hypothetical protein